MYDNKKLYALHCIALIESPSCNLSHEEAESVEQFLFSCKKSFEFWKHVLSWLRDNEVNNVETLTLMRKI